MFFHCCRLRQRIYDKNKVAKERFSDAGMAQGQTSKELICGEQAKSKHHIANFLMYDYLGWLLSPKKKKTPNTLPCIS